MVGLDIELEFRKIWCEGEDCTLLTSVKDSNKFCGKKIQD
jgi:hypothetical protein